MKQIKIWRIFVTLLVVLTNQCCISIESDPIDNKDNQLAFDFLDFLLRELPIYVIKANMVKGIMTINQSDSGQFSIGSDGKFLAKNFPQMRTKGSIMNSNGSAITSPLDIFIILVVVIPILVFSELLD